jgi:Zn-dependent M16 (insulinase) family peptidase
MKTINGFQLIKEHVITELNTNTRFFRHLKTGAELLSLENDDENKVFAITLRTPPPDSTGLPHIMEHSVLCGSRKYPVKKLLLELSKRTLSTLISAVTSPDKTVYPVASQNVRDLYHLIVVYLDAVFYPRLTPHTFEQEGWHYELESLEAPISINGVVFNEMKGVYSSPVNVLYRHSQRSVFPDTSYALDFGGDPSEIPRLTYEQFKAFHQTYYHPSNTRFFFYGDDDPKERLRFLGTYLDNFESVTVESNIPLQPRFDRPRNFEFPYEAGGETPDSSKGMFTMNWLLTETTDPVMTLGLNILEHILIRTSASPLRKALIDSGLGEALTGRGLNNQLRQMTFSIGLKGIAVEDVAKAEELILQTLNSLVQEGIEPGTIEASVNTAEFHLRENNTGGYPRGLLLMLQALITWLYDGDPLALLTFETPLQAVKDRLASGERYFEDLIERYLIKNNHRTTVLLRPDPETRQRQEAAEQQRLAQVRAAMSQEELRALIEHTHEFKRLQETPDPPEALATLPMLTLDDLEKKNKSIPLEVLKEGKTPILYHDLFTNGIVYLSLGFNLHTLPQELLPYALLFSQALVTIGTKTEDAVKLSQRIGLKTGGIWPSSFVSAKKTSQQMTTAAWLFISGKSTVARASAMLAILRDILLTVNLDNQERFKHLVLEAKARKETSLVPGGHSFINIRLGAHFHESGWIAEQMGGISSLFFLRRLVEEVEKDWPAVLAKLEEIRRILVNRNAMLCNITLDENNWTEFQPQLTGLLDALPAAPVAIMPWSLQQIPSFEGLIIPARVNYVAKGANLYELGYRLHGSVLVILNYVNTNWLADRLRIQGGAYGGFCGFNRFSGLFSYVSYYDPNLLHTLENYDQTSQFLQQTPLAEDELTKSISSVINQLDAYQLPDAKGYTSMIRYLLGINDEELQHIRDEIFATRPDDFKNFANILEYVRDKGLVVVMGSKEAIEQVNTAREGWLKTLKVF